MEQPGFSAAQECAIVLLRLIELRTKTRFDDARATLRTHARRLWGRHRLDRDFVDEVQEWLFRGGWTLFFAGTNVCGHQNIGRPELVRLSSNRLLEDLGTEMWGLIQNGGFDFTKHARLLRAMPTHTIAIDLLGR